MRKLSIVTIAQRRKLRHSLYGVTLTQGQQFTAMAVKSSERRNCWLEAAINSTRQWLISMRNKCFSEIKLKILFYAPMCRIKIWQTASKIFIPPINEFVKLRETSPNPNKTGSSQVGAISKAQKYSKNNYWKHLEKNFFSKKNFDFFSKKSIF